MIHSPNWHHYFFLMTQVEKLVQMSRCLMKNYFNWTSDPQVSHILSEKVVHFSIILKGALIMDIIYFKIIKYLTECNVC